MKTSLTATLSAVALLTLSACQHNNQELVVQLRQLNETTRAIQAETQALSTKVDGLSSEVGQVTAATNLVTEAVKQQGANSGKKAALHAPVPPPQCSFLGCANNHQQRADNFCTGIGYRKAVLLSNNQQMICYD